MVAAPEAFEKWWQALVLRNGEITYDHIRQAWDAGLAFGGDPDTTQRLRDRVREWEDWYAGTVADFVGLTSDPKDPDKLHDWEWLDDHRPAPIRMLMD